MSVYKEAKTNTWKVYYRYTDWQGERKQTTKRGFATKREALAWEREQMHKTQSELDMSFKSFVEVYTADVKSRIKENTWHTKEHIIRTKLLPYFGRRKIAEIQPKDILAWQNEMLNSKDKNGKPYSPVYLKTVHTQLSTIFNHACKFYGLRENPAMKVGNMGKTKSREMLIWTREEYEKFSFAVMDKLLSFYAFEMLYWCGIREGELLALTPADFNFERKVVSITKSYQRIDGRDVITDPKTPKSVRDIILPDFLVDEMKDFIGQMYGIEDGDRLFPVTKSYLQHEMTRGADAAGVKRIRIHDLRHSHISLLIDMGYSPVAIADRVGHESIHITLNYAHLFPTTQTDMASKRSLSTLALQKLGDANAYILLSQEGGQLLVWKEMPQGNIAEGALMDFAHYVRDNLHVNMGVVSAFGAIESAQLPRMARRFAALLHEPRLFDYPVVLLDANGGYVNERLNDLRGALAICQPICAEQDEINALKHKLDRYPGTLEEGFERVLENASDLLAALDLSTAQTGLWEMTRNISVRMEDRVRRIIGRIRPEIRRTMAYIQAHLREKLSREQLSSLAGFGDTYFSRMFKAEVGMSYTDYLLRARMVAAQDLLRNTDMPISEIADACGFYDASYFIGQYREFYGKTPREWRKNNGETKA